MPLHLAGPALSLLTHYRIHTDYISLGHVFKRLYADTDNIT